MNKDMVENSVFTVACQLPGIADSNHLRNGSSVAAAARRDCFRSIRKARLATNSRQTTFPPLFKAAKLPPRCAEQHFDLHSALLKNYTKIVLCPMPFLELLLETRQGRLSRWSGLFPHNTMFEPLSGHLSWTCRLWHFICLRKRQVEPDESRPDPVGCLGWANGVEQE